MRAEQVVTSFESRVKCHALVMVDQPAGQVDWGKEMVMPTSDYEEAVERLRQTGNALVGIQVSFVPTFYQQLMDGEGSEMKAFAEYEQRLALGCAAGHLTVETAVKSLIHLSSSRSSHPWGHKIDELLPQLPEPHKSEIETRLAAVGVKNLQNWQQQARCERLVTPTPEAFTAITKAACGVALYAADQFKPGLDIATDVRRKVSVIEQAITRLDLYTGRDRSGDATEGLGLPSDL